MNRFYFSLFAFFYAGFAGAQQMPAEIMIGNKYFYYQHSIAKSLPAESRFGIKHIASIVAPYGSSKEAKRPMQPQELMNQVYLTYRVNSIVSAMGGMMYTTVGKIKPSVAVQFAKRFKSGVWVLVPRMDIADRGAFELFGLFEYKPSIRERVKLYTRIQFMSSYGPFDHNRSYQQFRLGIEKNRAQFGLAFQSDEYGAKPLVLKNAGVFVRIEIF
jgi:hypothetical protein